MSFYIYETNKLPDVNEAYPQEESLIFSTCITCNDDIFHGDEIIEAYDYDFCGVDCYIDMALTDGTILKLVAGDDTTRIV